MNILHKLIILSNINNIHNLYIWSTSIYIRELKLKYRKYVF